MTEYGSDVLRVCAAYLCDRALAQDAVQDTFVKVWRKMDGYRSESSAKTWIMRIAINTCKDYKRTAWLRRVDRTTPAEALPLAAEDASAESRALFEDVLRLPDKLKQPVLLYHFQAMTLAQTAQALGVSRSAVQDRLKKAYALLRYAQEGEAL